jgi:TonB-dependent receptor
MKYFLSIVLLACSFSLFGQDQDSKANATISGTILDDFAQPYPGAQVELVNVKSIFTDMDGKYSFGKLLPGTYDINIKTNDFPTKTYKGITLGEGQSIILDASLTLGDTIEQIVLEFKRNQTTDQTATLIQKELPGMAEVVSGVAAGRTPASNTGDVIKMSSGASIQDNKFAIIRGLNDRYNAAYLNGSPLPSTEADRKAFAFDMFPSNMIDNLVISKTATPDMPGEFAGGIIQINTKSIPERSFFSIGVGGSYNTITTFKPQKTYEGGKLDWIGVDNGSRSMSTTIPAYGDYPVAISQQASLAQQFSTSWGLMDRKFSPNYSLQFSAGFNDTLFGKEIGVITALTYSRSFNYNETVRKGYTNGTGSEDSQIDYIYNDQNNNEQILAGGLANFTLKLNKNNNISFKNIYSINSDDKLIARTGEINPLEANPTLLRSNARWFTSNAVYSGQLTGDHYLEKAKIRVNWLTGYSNVKRVIPSLRRTIYTRSKTFNDPSDPNPLDTTYVANMSYSSVGPNYSGGMFFSENNENSINNRLDLSYTASEMKKVKTIIKLGLYSQIRDRDFKARQLGYTKYGIVGGNVNFDNSLLYLPEDQIYAPENMGLLEAPSASNGNVGTGGFKLTDGTKFSDSYTAQSQLNAAYLMGDNRFGKMHLVYGARGEYFQQELQARRDDNSILEINTKKLDILPSVNAIYEKSDRTNIRAAYSQTVNRPEYRELAPFAFYDFTTNFVVSGNDSLQRAKIQNFDLRIEKFPGRGQLFSATVFYKIFDNPIEQVSRPDVTGEISYKNAKKATNFGVELEARTLIASIIPVDSSSFLNNLTIFSNLSVIRSQVDVSDIVGSASTSRPLQGQSPYVLNAGLTYMHPDKKWSSTLYLNRVGERIAIVGNVNEPDLWENARTFLDFQVTYGFWKNKAGDGNKAELKLNVKNILAQDQLFYQNNENTTDAKGVRGATNALFIGNRDNNNGYQEGIDDEVWRTNFGRTISMSLTFKL